MQLSQLYSHIIAQLEGAHIDVPDLEARIILETRAQISWSDIIADGDRVVAPEPLKLIEGDMQRRIAGEPLSRIYGQREFWGLNFEISPDTLDPRPDTETLIEAALKAYPAPETPPKTILDLGAGSGCILISLLSEWDEASGVGIDKSPEAIKTAQKNAISNNVADRSSFKTGDWGRGIDQKFDLIVSNPPYIANQIIKTLSKEVQNHDPILALDGGNDGLDAYRQIFSELSSLLNVGGRAFFEIGFDQEASVVRLAEESRIRVKHVHHDLAGQPRVVEIYSGDK